MNPDSSTSRHVKIKMTKFKEKVLKAAREKESVTRETPLGCQLISYQNTHDIFHRTRTNNLKICTEPQKTQNCQSKPEEKE